MATKPTKPTSGKLTIIISLKWFRSQKAENTVEAELDPYILALEEHRDRNTLWRMDNLPPD